MGWKEFIAEVIQSLSWPATVLGVLYLFRGKLGDVIPRLLRVKHRETEIEFAEVLDRIQSKATALPVASPSQADLPESQAHLMQIARVSPKVAVHQAYSIAERSLFDLLLSQESTPSLIEMGMTDVKEVMAAAGLDPEDIKSFFQLRAVRNSTVHDEPLRVPAEQVESYVELALDLSHRLKKAISNKPDAGNGK